MKPLLWFIVFLLIVNLRFMYLNTDSIRSKVAEQIQSIKPYVLDPHEHWIKMCIEKENKDG